MAGLYVHIPFCVKKCHYCDFYSVENGDGYFEEYVNALVREISETELCNVNSVFIGGGTPTALPASLLGKLLSVIEKKVSPREFTIEANPGTLDNEKLKLFKNAGVTRLSIGLQAWQDRLLKIIGRIHTLSDFLHAVEAAEKLGFELNTDVMFNLPSQSKEELFETLFGVTELGISHVSCYSLTVAENTPFGRKLPFPLPSEADEREMYRMAVEFLASKGINRYEISNFARKGHECAHNLCYWHMDDYYAFGAGAHGFLEGKRYFYPDNIREYITSPRPIAEEVLTENDFVSEYCMLALRLSEGIKKADFKAKFGTPIENVFGAEIKKNTALGLLEDSNEALTLTELGFDFANLVAEDFILES